MPVWRSLFPVKAGFHLHFLSSVTIVRLNYLPLTTFLLSNQRFLFLN